MTTKRIFVICYDSPISNCFLLAAIKHTGHEMIIEYIMPPEALMAKTFSDLVKLNPQLLNHNLADFDIVVVLVCGPYGFPKDFIIPKGVVDELKAQIKKAEIEKAGPIRLVGINNFLPDEYLSLQKQIFDGQFIGSDFDIDTFREFLEG